MSAETRTARRTIRHLTERKGGEPIVILTAYTAPMAKLLDPYVDCLMVGDSLGMVVYGMETTLAVTLDMMIAHGKAVVRGSESALVVVDLPFGSYQESPEQAFRNAARLIAETGAQAVKLEGGRLMAPTIAFLVERGIPVMAHVGLMPQSVNGLGGFRAQGRTQSEETRIIDDAVAVSEAGAFAVVVEGTFEAVARQITTQIAIPTIGIGASPACDGQVLVTEDMLGLIDGHVPKFVKRFANLSEQVGLAVKTYADEVRTRQFPTDAQCYGIRTSK